MKRYTVITMFEDYVNRSIRIMEVCGTHTRAVSKSVLRPVLPPQVSLLSGPGCPVCVTQESYVDMALELLEKHDILIATFGDMLFVCGNNGCLADKRSNNIKVLYSPEEVLLLANNHKKKVVFLAVGFETTAPLYAALVKRAKENSINNLFFLTSIKRMEPVLRLILSKEKHKIDGIICPGHVAAVTGSDSFRFVTEDYGIPAVVCGFEPAEIKEGIKTLLYQISGRQPTRFINLYIGCVRPDGNRTAKKYIDEVFTVTDSVWRGIGLVKNSALILNEKYEYMDAKKVFGLKNRAKKQSCGCLCSDIIMGIKTPLECKQFAKNCTPNTPLGPCMVSAEGTCSVYYRYERYT